MRSVLNVMSSQSRAVLENNYIYVSLDVPDLMHNEPYYLKVNMEVPLSRVSAGYPPKGPADRVKRLFTKENYSNDLTD